MSPLNLLRKPDFVTGLVVAAVGTVYVINTFFIQTTGAAVDPSTLPRVVGAGLMVLGVLLALTAVRQKSKAVGDPAVSVTAKEATAPVESDAVETASTADEVGQTEGKTSQASAGFVALLFLIFFAYLYALIPVGFLLSTFMLLFITTTIYSPGRWLRNVLFAVIFSTSVYFIFTEGLGVFLPPGILG